MGEVSFISKLRNFLNQAYSSEKSRYSSSNVAMTERADEDFMGEALESRVLLAADLTAAMQTVQLVPNQSATVVPGSRTEHGQLCRMARRVNGATARPVPHPRGPYPCATSPPYPPALWRGTALN